MRSSDDRLAIEVNLAGIGLEQTGDHAHGRGLAAAARSQQRHHAPRLNVQGATVDRARLAEDFRDLGEAQRGRGNRDHDQAENTWLYFSISCGRIGFIKVQSGLKMPSRG
jgi:hypothetical protein